MPVMPCWVSWLVRSAAARAGLGYPVPGGGGGNGSGGGMGSSLRAGGVVLAGRGSGGAGRGARRWWRGFVAGDLAGDLAEAARGEAGSTVRDRDMDVAGGVQVEAPVQGAEDAGRQVGGAGSGSGACGRGAAHGMRVLQSVAG